MAKPIKGKSPEEILAEIEKLKKDYEQAEVALKESKKQVISEAVAKAAQMNPEADFEGKFKTFLTKRKSVDDRTKQIEKLRAEINTDLQYIKDQYKPLRDSLVGAGAKEEYLVDVLGTAPTVKAEKTTSGGEGKKRTKAKLNDGTTLSWTELLEKNGISHKDGNSAHREWDEAVKANPNLPKVEVVTA